MEKLLPEADALGTLSCDQSGETVVPFGKYKLSLDHLGKRGLNFDLGGKTPLGRKDKPHLKNPYELIQPVSGMVHYLHNEEE